MVSFLRNLWQWVGFGAWSFFWMSAAILWRVLFTRDSNVTLSWARRFWASGLIRLTRCDLQVAPGFVPQPGQPWRAELDLSGSDDVAGAIVVTVRLADRREGLDGALGITAQKQQLAAHIRR